MYIYIYIVYICIYIIYRYICMYVRDWKEAIRRYHAGVQKQTNVSYTKRVSDHLAFKSRLLGVGIALCHGGPSVAKQGCHWRSDHPALADDDRGLTHDADAVHGQQHDNAMRSAR